MAPKTRQIEVDVATADALEDQARARGISLNEFLVELAATADWPEDIEAMRREGRGPWSPEALEEDVRRAKEFERTREGVPFEEVEAWMESWGTENELPSPKVRKL